MLEEYKMNSEILRKYVNINYEVLLMIRNIIIY